MTGFGTGGRGELAVLLSDSRFMISGGCY
jgi:hypothetical protein